MKLSAKTDYACRALLALSLHWPKEDPLPINEIASRQKIPIKFLIHILIELKQLGYVTSIRGQKGGYVLKKAPREISLSDILRHFEEGHLSSYPKEKTNDVINSIWQETDQILISFLNNINFEEISRKTREMNEVIMYTI